VRAFYSFVVSLLIFVKLILPIPIGKKLCLTSSIKTSKESVIRKNLTVKHKKCMWYKKKGERDRESFDQIFPELTKSLKSMQVINVSHLLQKEHNRLFLPQFD
jgi:hypothetical protein